MYIKFNISHFMELCCNKILELNNFSQILFGFKKVNCTFTTLNSNTGGESYQNKGGIFYAYTFHIDTVEKRCRNYRDGLNTIVPPVGIEQRKVRHRFLLCKNAQKHSIKMKTIQRVTVNGEEIVINGKYSLPNALAAYDFLKAFSGMRVASEWEGDVNYQLDILQANNPNSFMVITMLRHLYNQLEPTLDKLENTKNPMYLLNDN